MDWLHQQCMYEEERARRSSFYDHGPLMSESTFFKLIVGFMALVAVLLGAHVAESWLARLRGKAGEGLAAPRRSVPAHVTGRAPRHSPPR